MEKQEIIEKLKVGDYDLIAEMTGYKKDTVRFQLNGKRTLKDKTKAAAEKLISMRETLIKQ